MRSMLTATLATVAFAAVHAADAPLQRSGIYPHLAYANQEGECGTGAVVPWAGRLWVITYGPHKPNGSSDKLYEIADDLTRTIRPESVGGTPANRLIHRESNQLFIGPYAIDAQRTVRVIPPKVMPGRLTGSTRHLTDPANKIYTATMEEGFYEIDVKTLAVTTLFPDANGSKDPGGSLLIGWHGKGLGSGQGRLVYANNGEHSQEAQKRFDAPSGVLAEWDGKAWTVIRRNQFTDVTGPGGISGGEHPERDPLWSIGWDHRSLLLALRDQERWTFFRLPKASHSYDGAHGWNTEWPRIRDIGADGAPELLMTMHGMFWHFPRTFSLADSAGIRPRSAYLKVVGDFARWNDRLVLGCDDTAQSEFLNKRKAKGQLAGPGQSQSNLWFMPSDGPDHVGPTTAAGAVWYRDAVKAGTPSDPMLVAGWARRGVHLANGGAEALAITLQLGDGKGGWSALATVNVPAKGAAWHELPSSATGEWLRAVADRDGTGVTVHLTLAADEPRTTAPDAMFSGLAAVDAPRHGGLVYALGKDRLRLALAAQDATASGAIDSGYYELDGDLHLARVEDEKQQTWMKEKLAIPRDAVTVDAASVLVVDDKGRRWRLPKGDAAYDAPTAAGQLRICREVATERDLFSCHGTFYELPAENADGYAKMRPISSHRFGIVDYASFRGLLVMTGVTATASGNEHVVHSADGKASAWVGAIDDLWRLGRPVGKGGPWQDTAVAAGAPSDAYLFWGYDRRTLSLSHRGDKPVAVTVEIDPTGEGLWLPYQTIAVPPGQAVTHAFAPAFQARWLRVTADRAVTATAQLTYE
jgi:hypothetical protein